MQAETLKKLINDVIAKKADLKLLKSKVPNMAVLPVCLIHFRRFQTRTTAV